MRMNCRCTKDSRRILPVGPNSCQSCHSDLLDLKAWAILLGNGRLFRKTHFELVLQGKTGILEKVMAFVESWRAWIVAIWNYRESGEWACRWISASRFSTYIRIVRSS